MNATKRTLACPALALFGVIATAEEVPAKQLMLNIEAQPMVDALNGWAQQTGLQIIVPAGRGTDQIEARSVQGRYTARDALAKLLEGTPLTFHFVNEKTVVVNERAPQTSLPARGSDVGFVYVAGAQVDRSDKETVANTQDIPSRKDKRVDKDVEEVIVTAQKRQESIQDVPISIAVLGGVELDSSTDESISEALNNVPGVYSMPGNLGLTQVSIRGVTSPLVRSVGSSPIAYYLDSVPFGFVKSAIAPDANAYDLDRVEVLRGPQGTLYGASALNGVVRVLTKGADTEKLEFKARTSASGTKNGGESYRGDMAVNVPIIEGKLAARAVVGYQNIAGWIDRPNDEDANDGELRNTRIRVRAQPTDLLSIDALAWISRSDYGAPAYSRDGERNASLVDEPSSSDYDAYGLRIGYDLPAFSISSMTSYLQYTHGSFQDYTPLGIAATRLTIGLESEVFSEEILLNSTHGGPWRWSLGAMYRDAEDHGFFFRRQYVAPTSSIDASESFAVFGEVTREFLAGQLELTGGLRYFEDEISQTEISRLNGATPLGRDPGRTFDAVSPRVVLSWHPGDRMTVYSSYSEGFRSGLLQSPAVVQAAPQFPPADPDTLKNYEIGAKGSFWDERINFDAAVYYEDWRDTQQLLVVTITPPGGIFGAVVNAESASGAGFEFALSTRPVDGLKLGINFSWNDLTMDSDVISNGAVLFSKGDRLIFSPKYTAGASLDYEFPLGGGGYSGRFSASANYTAEQQNRSLSGTNLIVTAGDPLLIADTSFSIDAPSHWSATLFIDNVNNEQGTPMPHWATQDWNLRVRPRTIGAQLEYRF